MMRPFASRAGDFGFVADGGDDIGLQREGRHLPDVPGLPGPTEAGELLEEFRHVGADLVVGGEQAEVGVKRVVRGW